MSTRTAKGIVLVAALAIVAIGCKKKNDPGTTPENPDDPALLAQDGADTSLVESDSEVLTSSLVSASSAGGLTLASASDLHGGELDTEDIGDGVKAFFFPRGCLTVANDSVAHTAVYTFGGKPDFPSCNGPNGLLKLQGEITVTYVATPNKLVLDLVGSGIKVNKATVDYAAHGEIVASGVDRTMTWKATLSGTTAHQRDFSRNNEKVVSWSLGERCFALAGTSEGTVKGRTLRTEITDFSRCAGACPAAGGKITITNVTTGTKVEIDFDGTDRGTFSSTKTAPTKFPLLCL